MTTMTAERGAVRTPEQVAAIENPVERLTAAADLVRASEQRAEGARSMRDMAAIYAHLDDGVPPVVMYRDVLQCSRGLFVRMVQRAPAKRDRFEDAVSQARESAEAVRRHEATIEAARVIRDETALALMNGWKDPYSGEKHLLSNADVARATGLSTARIAQMRTGTR